MPDRSIVICGLPDSGKTTFLAALWHLVSQREGVDTQLKFVSLRDGDSAHLNKIMAMWQEAREQPHTHSDSRKLVSMNLKDGTGTNLGLTFPDLSGESYQHMWETRECDPDIAAILRSGSGVLLFVHADKINRPLGVAETVGQARRLGVVDAAGKPAAWHPKFAPTQVQLVELLQLLRSSALNVPAQRLGIILSAWDKVEAERREPAVYLTENLPLLDQYLKQGADGWDFRIYGLSAQGGEYEPELKQGQTVSDDLRAKIDAVRTLPTASSRIKVYSPALSHDLTEPLAWLMG
jgi:hypothetical protein